MRLYLLTQEEQTGWDTYDSCVVSAENESSAKRISPSGYYEWSNKSRCWEFCYVNGDREPTARGDWANQLENISAVLLSDNCTIQESKVIIASFHAGESKA